MENQHRSEECIQYIAEKTGADKETVIKVLLAEDEYISYILKVLSGKSEVREVTLEQKVEELEKRMVALEICIPKQPSAEEIANKIKEILKKEIDLAATITY